MQVHKADDRRRRSPSTTNENSQGKMPEEYLAWTPAYGRSGRISDCSHRALGLSSCISTAFVHSCYKRSCASTRKLVTSFAVPAVSARSAGGRCLDADGNVRVLAVVLYSRDSAWYDLDRASQRWASTQPASLRCRLAATTCCLTLTAGCGRICGGKISSLPCSN